MNLIEPPFDGLKDALIEAILAQDRALVRQRQRIAELEAWLEWCLDNCDDSPEWNFGTTATGEMLKLLAGGAAMSPDQARRHAMQADATPVDTTTKP